MRDDKWDVVRKQAKEALEKLVQIGIKLQGGTVYAETKSIKEGKWSVENTFAVAKGERNLTQEKLFKRLLTLLTDIGNNPSTKPRITLIYIMKTRLFKCTLDMEMRLLQMYLMANGRGFPNSKIR